MIVNPLLRTIFLANPKCASSSVEALLRRCPPLLKSHDLPPPPKGLYKRLDAKHLANEIMPIINSTYPEIDFTVFCIVREPISRLYSNWKYRQSEGKTGTLSSTIDVSFEDFLRDFIEVREGKATKTYANVRSQTDYVFNEQRLISEKVFTVEKIHEVENFLSERCGKKISLDVLNKSIALKGDPLKIDEELMQGLEVCLKREFEIYDLASTSPDAVKNNITNRANRHSRKIEE